jgi:lipid-A-disaccharide synthase-like uncharacterized protein
MKSGPILAMILVLALGAWLVLQPTLDRHRALDPTASTFKMVIGPLKIDVETRPDPAEPAKRQYRVANPPASSSSGFGWPSTWAGWSEFEAALATHTTANASDGGSLLKGFLNITSWSNFIWVALGLMGQGCFFGRMLIQWVTSERKRESVIPPLFWWLSFFGGVLLFVYFVWRTDVVGVLGQSTGIVIYARNLRLIGKQKRRAQRQHLASDPEPNPDADPAADPPTRARA